MLAALRNEHQAATPSEDALIEGLAQHRWLGMRAMNLQTTLLENNIQPNGILTRESHKMFALYLRYEVTHDRGFHKCLKDLLRIKAERRKAQNGFEQQKLKQAAEIRKIEVHQARVRIADAKVAYAEARKQKLEDTRKPLSLTAKAA